MERTCRNRSDWYVMGSCSNFYKVYSYYFGRIWAVNHIELISSSMADRKINVNVVPIWILFVMFVEQHLC